MTISALPDYKSQLIEHAMAVGALKFGTFTLKSGRYVFRTQRIRKLSERYVGPLGYHRTSSTLDYCVQAPY